MTQRALVDLHAAGPPRLVSQACADPGRLAAASGVKLRKVRWALGLDPGGASLAAVDRVARGLRVVVAELRARERQRAEQLTVSSPPWMTAERLVHAGIVWRVRRRLVERLATIGVKACEVTWPWEEQTAELLGRRGSAEDYAVVRLARSDGAQADDVGERFRATVAGAAEAATRLAAQLWHGWSTRWELERRGVGQTVVDSLLEGAPRSMSTEMACAVYDVLVRECGAEEDERDAFAKAATGVLEWGEWRFRGALGLGGKIYEDRRSGPWVRCYPEDETPERRKMMGRANEAIAALWSAGPE